MVHILWYHGRSRSDTDREFIEARMSVIPKKYQQRVADRYEKLYRSLKTGNRKVANSYLHRIAVYFRKKLRK